MTRGGGKPSKMGFRRGKEASLVEKEMQRDKEGYTSLSR